MARESKNRRGIGKRTAAFLIAAAALIALCAAALGMAYSLYRAGNASVLALADRVKALICDVRLPGKAPDSGGDTESYSGAEVERTERSALLLNSAKGYYIELPADTEFDFFNAPVFVKAESGLFSVTISREYSTERSAEAYEEHYFDRFLLDAGWRGSNGAELLADERSDGLRRFTVALSSLQPDCADTYTYVNVFTGTRIFYRMTFKYFSADREKAEAAIDAAVASFAYFRPSGSCDYGGQYAPDASELSAEALAAYNAIAVSDGVGFGIFTEDIQNTGINETIPALESELGNRFEALLIYRHLHDDFPAEFMERCAAENRLVELTYQITVSNNDGLDGYSPQLDVYRGGCDDAIRKFAREAAEFGKPFLLRLSNEMNSDWTSWSGVINMCDAEIYTAVWRRIHGIFAEEGANNAIWVWNPNDRDYPPACFNSAAAYWPGEEYVNVVGITGYNTGDYYADTGERWRSFKDIYTSIERDMSPLFGEYPWIITEFSSASAGGDKAKWIDGMFKSLPLFPNIKLAVWFDSVDLNPAYPGEYVIARDYRIDDAQSTLDAFTRGFSE